MKMNVALLLRVRSCKPRANPILRAALGPYVEAGRPIKNRRGRRVTRTTVDADTRTVKEWARANGYEVNDRGRVPAHIRQASDAAN